MVASVMAEGVGFEPTEACTSHAFQACRFGRFLASLLTPGADLGPAAWPGEVTGPIGSGPLRTPAGCGDGRVLCNVWPRIRSGPEGSSLQRYHSCAADRLAVTTAGGCRRSPRVAGKGDYVVPDRFDARRSGRGSSSGAPICAAISPKSSCGPRHRQSSTSPTGTSSTTVAISRKASPVHAVPPMSGRASVHPEGQVDPTPADRPG